MPWIFEQQEPQYEFVTIERWKVQRRSVMVNGVIEEIPYLSGKIGITKDVPYAVQRYLAGYIVSSIQAELFYDGIIADHMLSKAPILFKLLVSDEKDHFSISIRFNPLAFGTHLNKYYEMADDTGDKFAKIVDKRAKYFHSRFEQKGTEYYENAGETEAR